jgi:hypothetical protein
VRSPDPAGARRRLEATLRQAVLPALAVALGRRARERGLDPADDKVRERLERAARILVVRALFRHCAGGETGLEGEDLGQLAAGLLSLRLSSADGELRWQADAGERKGGGVHYTPAALVGHLVAQTVAPAFRAHLLRVRRLAAGDPEAAAAALLDFAVLDPACGGGRFLLAALEELSGQVAGFLAGTPLPAVAAALGRLRAAAAGAAVGDAVLLRRLVLERCVFGVDASPLGVEVAVRSLRLAVSAPGLPPPRLGGNVVVGDALVLDWPAAFPGVFARRRPGFDAVVGNPPWEEVTVEALAFYGRFAPGLRGLPERPRAAAVAELLARRPELPGLLAAERQRAALRRRRLGDGGDGPAPGDPDLYRAFCRRYRELLRDGGALGVVLPRGAFAAGGSAGFRRWLLAENRCRRLDFLVNRRCWIFDTHPQYTLVLVAAERARPAPGHALRVAGVAATPEEWERQAASPGFRLPTDALGPGLTVPLLRSQAEADLLAKLRRGTPFPCGPGGRWRCFPVAELHETGDRRLWEGTTDGLPLWKGESFGRYDPHGAGARSCPTGEAVLRKLRKPRPGERSRLAGELDLAARRRAVLGELGRARVAFRDVSRASDGRTVRACFVPPGVLLTNKAPYLAFAAGGDHARAACLGIMNSLPFDWQARRFVEINLSFFILEGLVVPDLAGEDLAVVARAAARLSCVDGRFAELAGAVGVQAGPLGQDERERLLVEVDARVARGWSLTAGDLEVLLADFTLDAVPAAYRRRLRARLAELSAPR